MAGEGLSSVSPRSNAHQRNSSSVSLSKVSGGQRPKASKTHAVGKHNRNTSFGRNLNKLARLTNQDDQPVRQQRSKSTYTPSSSPSAASHVRRNKSDVALPRAVSKVQIKKNQSAVALRRNESASRLKRLSRPTTPREDEDSQLKGHAQPAFGFGSDEEEEDDEDEWTEESASQSPNITRSGSMKGPRPDLKSHDTNTSTNTETQTIHGESPTTPVALEAQRHAVSSVVPPLSSKPPDPAVVTHRLLSKTSSTQLAPKLSAISAGGSSGMQSPAHQESNETPSMLPSHIAVSKEPHLYNSNQQQQQQKRADDSNSSIPSYPSLGRDGVSRFLDSHAAASSSGRSATALHSAMDMLRTQESRSRSPSPNPAAASVPLLLGGEGVRRANSIGHLAHRDAQDVNARTRTQWRAQYDNNNDRRENARASLGHSRSGSLEDDPRAWIVNPDPLAHRRSGGNTQAKMDLWRTQAQAADAEPPSGGPPASLIKSMRGLTTKTNGYLGEEERGMRIAEEAEKELAFLRVYRNPVLESTERVRRERRKRDGKEKKNNSLEVNDMRRPRSKGKDYQQPKDVQHLQSQAKEMGKGRPNTAPPPAAADRSSDLASTTNKTNSLNSSVDSGGTVTNPENLGPSTPSRRSVKFDVGADGAAELERGSSSLDDSQKLSDLLRSLWEGAETEVDS